MPINQKSLSLPRNLALTASGELLIVFFNKGKSAIPPLFNGPEVLSCASAKAKLYFFASFPFKTYLKLHHIHVTPKLVRRL